MSMDEQELMSRVQAGDRHAFDELMSVYKDRIVNYLYQFTGDYQRAVELAQETFIRVYFKAGKYRPIAPVSSWIFAIASNLARSDARRETRRATVSLDDIPNDYAAGAYASDRTDSGLIRNLRQALEELPPRYRIPVILKDMEGFSQEEIARIIRTPVGTVKARISRGRARLRKKLEGALKSSERVRECEVSENGRA
jgi:RNA polymerase sigma-70 factor (ECF subfamily)